MEGRGDKTFVFGVKAPLIKTVCVKCGDKAGEGEGGYVAQRLEGDPAVYGNFVLAECDGRGDFFCGKCLPAAREAWLAGLPKCGVCGKPCEGSMFAPYAFDGYRYSKAMRVCSEKCLRVKAEEEKGTTLEMQKNLAAFELAVASPECPPLFSKETEPDDAAIVLFVATLPQKWLNAFVFNVLMHIERHPWIPAFNFGIGAFEYQYRNPEDIYLEDYPRKGNTYKIKTPLPKSLWQWVSDRASDAVAKKVERKQRR